MVRIVDEGGYFDAPIEKVWELIQAHQVDTPKIHTAAKNYSAQPSAENQGVSTFDTDVMGQMMRVRLRVTVFPPTAQVLEFLEGPLAGTKMVNYYTPNGDKTGITVIGDFVSPMLPEPAVNQAARDFLDRGFAEDGVYLKKLR